MSLYLSRVGCFEVNEDDWGEERDYVLYLSRVACFEVNEDDWDEERFLCLCIFLELLALWFRIFASHLSQSSRSARFLQLLPHDGKTISCQAEVQTPDSEDAGDVSRKSARIDRGTFTSMT